jgi:preprotein translocase subunit Sec61beta
LDFCLRINQLFGEKKMKKVLQPLWVGTLFAVSFAVSNCAFGQKTLVSPVFEEGSRPQIAQNERKGGDSLHRSSILSLSEIAFEGQTERKGGDSVYRAGIVSLSEIAFEGQTERKGGDSVYRAGIVSLSEIAFEGQTERKGGDSVYRAGIVSLSEIAFEGQTERKGGDSLHRAGIVSLSEIAFEGQTERKGGDSVYRAGIVNLSEIAFEGQTERKGGDSVYKQIGLPSFELAASPNPFAYSTKLSFVAPSNGHVKLEILNLQGVHIATLLDGEIATSSEFAYDFQADTLANGIYLARLTADNGTVKQIKLLVQH